MVVEKGPEENTEKSLPSQQQIAFAKVLAGNDKKKRDHGLKKLVKWLTFRSNGDSEFTENDFMTIWAGLYYSMWMSDKPLVQEELAESLSQLVHCFASNESAALLFIRCFYLTMTQSWAGLDQFRMDKFCMLNRRFLRQCLEHCGKKSWDIGCVKRLMRTFNMTVLDESAALGLKLHFIEVFLEELAKVGKDEIPTKVQMKLLEPFVKLTATTTDVRVRTQLNNFFRHLIRQTDVALEYEEKFQAWRQAGFPGGDISVVVPDDSEPDEVADDALDEDEKEEEEMVSVGDKIMDPRAGSVHVELSQIPVVPGSIIKLLKRYQRTPDSTLKGRRMVKSLIAQFRTLKRGKCPYGIKKVPKYEKFGSPKFINNCAKKLVKASLKTKQKKLKKRDKINRLNAALNCTQSKNGTISDDDPVDSSATKKGLKKQKKIKNDNLVVLSEIVDNSNITADLNESTNGKDNQSLLSPKKRKVDKGETTPKGHIGKKRRISTGNWVVDTTEPDEAAAPPKIITLEKKNPWAEPLQEGETEIVIKKRKVSGTPVFWKNALAKVGSTPNKTPSFDSPNGLNYSKNDRRISFNLAMNREQEKQEYLEEVQRSPQIPFDSSKKPKQSALKAGLVPSPINPFYRSKKLLL